MANPAIPILESFGGLETDTERTSRTPGRASTCTNMRVGAQGRTLRKMQGASRWVNDQLGGAVNVLGFFQFKNRGLTRFDVARVPAGYFVTQDGGPVWDSAQSNSGSQTGIPRFVTANGQMYVVDGTNAYFWDGTGTGTSRFSNWFRLQGPTSGKVGPNSVDSPLVAAINSTISGVIDLSKSAEYEVGFIFHDNANPTKQSPPSAILQIRTPSDTDLNLRIDTGYAGRDRSTTSLPTAVTHSFHPLPTEVALLDADSRITAIASKKGVPGIWYLKSDNATPKFLNSREIPIATQLAAAPSSTDTSLTVDDAVEATLKWQIGDQLVIDSGEDKEEVVRITAFPGGSVVTVTALINAHDINDDVIPIASLVLNELEGTGSAGDEPGTTQYTDFYGPPRDATGIVAHMDAIWTWGSPNFPTRFWFTDPDTPETFPANNFIDVDPDNPFDPIVNIVPFGKGFGSELLILRKNSVWRLQGNSLTTFLNQMVQTGPSCVDVDSAVALPDGTIMWAGFEDIWRFDGSSVISMTKERIRHDYRSSFNLTDVGGKLT